MTDCPNEEILAAFLDGRLDPEARDRVFEHLADCGECREVVYAGDEMRRLGVAEGRDEEAAAVPEVLEFRSRGRYAWGGIGVAAAAVLLLFFPPVQERIALISTGGMSEVKKAYEIMPQRPMESRLIGFAYHEFKAPTRSGNDSEGVSLEKAFLLEAAARIAPADDDPSWRQLRALASAQLLLGERDKAVAMMERAFVLKPGSPGLRSDLAAVYVERARWNGRPEYAAQALDAAERAWTLARTPEAAWNRALALELSGRDEEARRAWKEFLKRDSSSPWAGEAEQKLQDLENR